ncbi:MAG: metal-dependent hydrolase [Rubrivivax sp.]
MDSLSQWALGAAVGVAVMGRRTAPWKAAMWGGVLGTLPDLDALIDHGDPVLNMVLHRAETHALFWQSLAALPLAALITWVTRRGEAVPASGVPPPGSGAQAPGTFPATRWSAFASWLLTVWLVLVTHALLDAMTVYGTRLALPFSSQPYGLGSIFIIDPLYTVPLLVGLSATVLGRSPGRARWNLAGLVLSTAYLGWSAAAQHHVAGLVHGQLAARGEVVTTDRVLVTPTAFNTVLWRIVVMHPTHVEEGFYSLADRGRAVRFRAYPLDPDLHREVQSLAAVRHIQAFSRGFFRVDERQGLVRITDLRMGQEPAYVFSFGVARRGSALQALETPTAVGGRSDIDIAAGLRWLLARAGGQDLDAPGAGQGPGLRFMTCNVAYLPQRSSWQRRVTLRWDGENFQGMEIDGLRPHAVSAQGPLLATALDNERILLDLAALEWSSDFRGQATGRGRCEWVN